MRKPSEMSYAEIGVANNMLPKGWDYNPQTGEIEADCDDMWTIYLPMADLKKFLDYLTSINVNPYA